MDNFSFHEQAASRKSSVTERDGTIKKKEGNKTSSRIIPLRGAEIRLKTFFNDTNFADLLVVSLKLNSHKVMYVTLHVRISLFRLPTVL
jgi:hypothetical protein